MIRGQFRVVRCFVVIDPYQSACLPGDFGGVGEDATDELPAEVHLIVLQDRQFAIGRVGEPGSVEHGQHVEYAVESEGSVVSIAATRPRAMVAWMGCR